eukprot:7762289-Pyramimonas_sp.AAC.1
MQKPSRMPLQTMASWCATTAALRCWQAAFASLWASPNRYESSAPSGFRPRTLSLAAMKAT